jgi:hypothetical protein
VAQIHAPSQLLKPQKKIPKVGRHYTVKSPPNVTQPFDRIHLGSSKNAKLAPNCASWANSGLPGSDPTAPPLGGGDAGAGAGDLGKALGDLLGGIPTFGGDPPNSPHYEPLILNLTGGPTLTMSVNGGVAFDYNNNGFEQATGHVPVGRRTQTEPDGARRHPDPRPVAVFG